MLYCRGFIRKAYNRSLQCIGLSRSLPLDSMHRQVKSRLSFPRYFPSFSLYPSPFIPSAGE